MIGLMFRPNMGWNMKSPFSIALSTFFSLGTNFIPLGSISTDVAAVLGSLPGISLGVLSLWASFETKEESGAKDGELSGIKDRVSQVTNLVNGLTIFIIIPMMMAPWFCDYNWDNSCGESLPRYKDSTELCWNLNGSKLALAWWCAFCLFIYVIGLMRGEIK